MATSTASIDLTSLRTDLKSWEREFKAKKGREPTREDIKKVPDIDAKYKLYNKSRSKAATESKETLKPEKRKGKPADKPSPTASSATAVDSVAGVEETFNPFRSPTKGGPSLKRPTPKSKTPLDHDPFAAGDSNRPTTTSLFAKLTTPPSAINPFASPAKKSIFPTSNMPIPSSPTKSILKPTNAAMPISTDPFDPAPSASKYVHASSPSKLRTLIQQSKTVDTPRTKARKRLAGEEDWTPDKRRRTGGLGVAMFKGKEKDQEEMEVEEDEEMEVEFGPTPKKTEAAKRFKPLFDSPQAQDSKPKGIFSKRTVTFNVPPAPSRMPSASQDAPKSTDGTASAKRPASPEAAAKPTTRLLPPSPPAAVPSKAKPRKRAKKSKKMESADEEDESSSDRETREIPYTRWGGLQATRRKPTGAEGSDDEVWDLTTQRHPEWLQAAGEEAVEEEMTVRLPTDMFGLLDLESPKKQKEDEEEVVRRIFQPNLKTSSGEVWGAGEFESRSDGDEADDDWEEEPEGWKGMADL